MKRPLFHFLLVLSALLGLTLSEAEPDISEYFLRDPYDQLDLFRQSNPKTKDTTATKEEESDEKTNDEGLYEEYYDYLYDVGVLPAKETTT